MRRGIGSASSAAWTSPGSNATARSPARVPRKNRNVPLPSSRRCSASTRVPQLSANASELSVLRPRLVEARREARDEGLLQGGERLGRQLLGADFKEEIAPLGLHATAPAAAASAGGTGFSSGKPSAARLSRYAFATALASVRTRRR